MNEQQQLESAIAGLETQRGLLGDAVVDAAVGPMRQRLALLVPALPAPAAAQALRLVTVLFTDMVGSTRMAERVDAEEMLELSSEVLATLAQVVVAHQGRVLRYTGDGLKAIFGADTVREDDAERAVCCALALQAAASELARGWCDSRPGVALAIRVGLHSGAVALGGGVEGGSTAMGATVNLAARMEQAAEPGSVRISAETHALVRGLFDVEAQAPVVLKGVAEAVLSYRVVRLRLREHRVGMRGIDGLSTRMIGREAELNLLQTAYLRLFEEARLQAVSVVAEPGLGKSRLLQEFEGWRQDQPRSARRLVGRATPQTEGQPYGLLRDLLAGLVGIADDDSPAQARARFENVVVPLFADTDTDTDTDTDGADLAEGHAHLLGHLIGFDWRHSRHVRGIGDDPGQLRARALHAAVQLFRRLWQRVGAPLLVEIEDLHWADNESLDFLSHLCDVDGDVPLLLLAFCRGTLYERRPDLDQADGLHRRIDLLPLDACACSLMADTLLGKLPQIPDRLREQLTGGAEGNPFHMEELVRMLIDQGAIRTGATVADPWTLDLGRLDATRVPSSLTGVLQARLDGLPTAERLTLQEASVIGPVFRNDALDALDTEARHELPALVRRALALPREGTAGAPQEFAFKHQLLHQVTYGTVVKRTRRQLHHRMALWLAGRTGLQAHDALGVIAHHFEQAGDEAQAAEFHTRAAEQASRSVAHEAVLRHVAQALGLIERLPGADTRLLRWRLLDVRERSFEMKGERTAQQADLAAMAALATDWQDPARLAHTAYRRCVMAQRVADWPACERAGREAMEFASCAGQDELRLLAMRLVGRALVRPGEVAAGKALVQRALAEARTIGLRMVESYCLNSLLLIASFESDPVAVLGHAREALAINRAIGNRHGEAVSLSNVGCGLLDLGDHDQAGPALEACLRLLRASGDRLAEATLLCLLSTAALRQGDADHALSLACAARELSVAVQAPHIEAIALVKIGNAELALGRPGEAAAACGRSHRLAVAIDDPVRHDARAGLARAALAAGLGAQALAHVDALTGELAAGASLDGSEDPRLIEWRCHEVLAAAGDDRAAVWLDRAHAALQAQADAIADAALRESFLANIATHRAIVAAFAAPPG